MQTSIQSADELRYEIARIRELLETIINAAHDQNIDITELIVGFGLLFKPSVSLRLVARRRSSRLGCRIDRFARAAHAPLRQQAAKNRLDSRVHARHDNRRRRDFDRDYNQRRRQRGDSNRSHIFYRLFTVCRRRQWTAMLGFIGGTNV